MLDGTLQFSQVFGGSANDNPTDMTLSHNLIYMTGGTNSPDFQVTTGSTTPAEDDAFVTAMDPTTGLKENYFTEISRKYRIFHFLWRKFQ